MKVIEQLIQHFHARGVLSAEEIDHLLAAGYIRRHDLFGHAPADDEPAEPTPLYEPGDDDRLDRLGEEIASSGRRVGRRKGGKGKVKPTGHDLTPLAAVLATHLDDREPYPALVELGQRLTAGVQAKPGVRDWRAAATAVAAASPADLEAALVATFNHRPPALGELWHWCEIDRLFDWAEHADNAGPVADALAALLATDVPTRVGRLAQLKKLPPVYGLLDLLRARRAVLGALRGLFDRHFHRLKVWLVAPGGPAAAVWPALPWAFVLQYNAGTVIPPGYLVAMSALPTNLRPLCWETAWRMGGTGLLSLIPARIATPPNVAGDGWLTMMDRPFKCPYDWTV